MAIRIIDTTPHKSVVKEVVCRNCGVTLEYTPADIQSVTVCDYRGDSDTYHHIKCPNCSHEQTVNYR